MKSTNQLIVLLCLSMGLLTFSCKPQLDQKTDASTSSAESSAFKGDIKLDVRDSKADWEPYIRKKAPEGSPNILFILYDDTGLAHGRHTEEELKCQHWINWLLMD